jgi:EF hand
MRRIFGLALSAGLLAACGASPVVAPEPSQDEPRDRARQRWDAADTDRNGRLSRAETQASMPGIYDRFDRFDVNGDGEIATDEAHAFHIDDR